MSGGEEGVLPGRKYPEGKHLPDGAWKFDMIAYRPTIPTRINIPSNFFGVKILTTYLTVWYWAAGYPLKVLTVVHFAV